VNGDPETPGRTRNRIVRIEATPVFAPCDVSVGPVSKPASFSGTIVEVETADGLVGHGFTAITNEEIVASAIRDVAAPNLLGCDAFAREAIVERLYWLLTSRGQTGHSSHVVSAIDIALWDIAGRRLGEPIWRLLGGARDQVAVYTTFGFPAFDRDELVAAARHLVEHEGRKRLKIVVGYRALATRDEGRSPDEIILDDVARVRAVRDAVGPDVQLFIDGGCNLDSFHALRLANLLTEFDISFYEEPVRANDIGRLADMRRQTRIPIASGQNEGQLYRFRDMLAAGAVDVLQPNVVCCGGFTVGAKAAALAHAFNVPIDNGGAFPFHNMHLHAGVSNGGMVEWHLFAEALCRLIFTGLPASTPNTLALSMAPGLGFELNRDVLRDLRRLPLSSGRGSYMSASKR
jgi:L-rhamnonate dehydratase